MPRNRIVVRYLDGRLLKGHTEDFLPAKPVFHLMPAEAGAGPVEVRIADLKAVFFVRDHAGDPRHDEVLEFQPAHPPVGRKIRVVFADGETLVGTTQGYDPKRVGFFLIPADPGSNNERCFVVSCATKSVSFL